MNHLHFDRISKQAKPCQQENQFTAVKQNTSFYNLKKIFVKKEERPRPLEITIKISLKSLYLLLE